MGEPSSTPSGNVTALPLFRTPSARARAADHLRAAASGRPGRDLAATVPPVLFAPDAPVAHGTATAQPATTPATATQGTVTAGTATAGTATAGTAAPVVVGESVDWDLVEMLQQEASEVLSEIDAAGRGDDIYLNTATATAVITARDQDARRLILRAVNDYVTRHILLKKGQSADWTEQQREHYTDLVFNEIFRWGRLQPLLTEPGAKHVNILGHDNVIVRYQDGHVEHKPPIARTDAELMRVLQNVAKKSRRDFSDVRATVGIDLDGARINLLAPSVAARPSAGIRIHNHVDVDLDDLVGLGTLTPHAAQLLTAAIRAERNIIISGEQGAGKTTLLRACAAVLDPDEVIATVESEYELYLHKLPHRHRAVLPIQMREATGEGPHGGYSLRQGIKDALRQNLKRVFVGEVRGTEVKAMMEAMQIGGGSMATIHAESPADAIFRLANLIIEEGSLTTDYYPLRLIQQHIRLIVQIRELPGADGAPRHVVTEISEVTGPTVPGGPPLAQPLLRYTPAHGHATFTTNQPTTALRTRLEEAGLPAGFFHKESA